MAEYKYYRVVRPGKAEKSFRVHAPDCRYLEGTKQEVENLRGASPERAAKAPNACGVCVKSKRFREQGAEYKRQKTT